MKINYDWKTSNDEKLNLIICFSPLYEVHLVCTSHGTLMLQSFVPNLFLQHKIIYKGYFTLNINAYYFVMFNATKKFFNSLRKLC